MPASIQCGLVHLNATKNTAPIIMRSISWNWLIISFLDERFLKKGLFLIIQSSDFSTRYQKKHSQKHFWGEEADARRLQILFLILAHYVCVLGCCCCCNNSCWVVNSLGSRITYISHLRTEQRPEVHLIRKYFWWPIMT